MTPMRYLLAIPRQAGAPASLGGVARPELVLESSPAIWLAPGTPSLDLPGHGLMVGVAFTRDTFRLVEGASTLPKTNPDPSAWAAALLRHCWGAYLAVLADPATGGWSLLCDPSGLLPAYRFLTSRHVLVASDPALLAELPDCPMAVSYPAIAAHLQRPELRRRETCLADLDELTPGALHPLAGREKESSQLWSPARFLPSHPTPGFTEAAEELRDTARSVMRCWSGAFGRVAVAASGGVDSSFIAAALGASRSDFDCITIATRDRSGDERHHAKLVAASLGVRCVERVLDPARFDPTWPASAGLPRPARRSFLAVLDTLLVDALAELGAGMVLDGNGGDNLFCFLHSSAPVLDRLRAEGLNRRTLRTLLDMCRITGCSIPTMLRAVLRRLRNRDRPRPWPTDMSFLASDKVDPGIALTPWLEAMDGPWGGKHDHISLVMHAQNHIHGLAGTLPRFSPLASQPLVEFCFGIPTWLWCQGGTNRALARTAFARELPAAILARTSKAGPDSFIRAAFAAHRPAIAERLLDGLLASHHVIDRPAVERALRVDYGYSDDGAFDRLLDLLEAENWCQSWTR